MINNTNNYEDQKLRGLKRKYEYVIKKGGRCKCCGYNKNLSALEFHHRNANEKEFQIDIRAFSNHSLEKLEKELEKCELLCANCHREYHNSDLTMDKVSEIIKKAYNKKSFNNQKTCKQTCIVCGKSFLKSKGKIYCSKECRWKAKGYPSIDEISEQYKILKSWEKVVQYFGLTRKIIQCLRKRHS